MSAPGTGSRLVWALEQAWGAVRDSHPGAIPDLIIVLGTGGPKKVAGYNQGLGGCFTPGKWKSTGGDVDELLITTEQLATGGYGTMLTLVHECCHAANFQRGFRDVEGSDYHTTDFLAKAEQFGLEFDGDPHPKLGFSAVQFSTATEQHYAAQIEDLERELTIWLPYSDDKFEHDFRPMRESVALHCRCSPPRKLTVAETFLKKGELICGSCCKEFEPLDEEEVLAMKAKSSWQHRYRDYIS